MSERPLIERMASMVRSLGRVGQMNAAVLMLDASAEIIRLREELSQKESNPPVKYDSDAIDAVQRLIERGKVYLDSEGYLRAIPEAVTPPAQP